MTLSNGCVAFSTKVCHAGAIRIGVLFSIWSLCIFAEPFNYSEKEYETLLIL